MARGGGEDGRAGSWRINPLFVAIGILVVLIAAFALYSSTRNPDQDKLKDGQLTESQSSDPEARCSAQATYDLIKRELFREAAQRRGGDEEAYERIAAQASVRMEDPAMESQDKDSGAVNCSGSLSLDLPPSVAVAGGGRTLMSDVDYTIVQAADDSGASVQLHNADGIINPLATLTQTDQPQVQPGTADDTNTVAPNEPQPAAPEPPPQAQQPAAPPIPQPAPAPAPRTAESRASFDCNSPRSRGEVAVCSDAGLASLDRAMAAQFRRALAIASPNQQALLRSTGQRFTAYRDRCSTTACIGDAYEGRMREIRDIMEGRWQQPQ